jgi:hypothetical protein
MLKRLVARLDSILLGEALAEEGAIVFAKACELRIEGIVSTRAVASTGAGKAAIGWRRRTRIS